MALAPITTPASSHHQCPPDVPGADRGARGVSAGCSASQASIRRRAAAYSSAGTFSRSRPRAGSSPMPPERCSPWMKGDNPSWRNKLASMWASTALAGS
jgi:hypothetical protein